MSSQSSIEWTNATWNPVTGCTKVSPGCVNCYAERFAERWRGIKDHPYEQGFDLTLWKDRLEMPLSWREPKQIFVNSMSDLFHERVPFEFIENVFSTMEKADWHTFQILTKRSDRLAALAPKLRWPKNIWMGVSVENQKMLRRAEDLKEVPSAVRFLSVEPLLERLGKISLSGIDWVIVGGESGPGARPMQKDWVTEIRDQCLKRDIKFFFKQWGGVQKSRNGRKLDKRFWDEMPEPKRRWRPSPRVLAVA